jgi:hypothetical protein
MRRLLPGLCAAVVVALGALPAPARADGAANRPREPSPIVAQARATVGWMAARSDRIQDWLAEARRRRNPHRASCLDDLLNQSHAVERIGQDELAGIVRAVHHGDEDSLDRRRTRLAVLAARSEQLMALAAACLTGARRDPPA